MRGEQELREAMERHAHMVRRLCMVHLKNSDDTQDVFQTVFLQYALSTTAFESAEHEKAWMIRVTINACRDVLKNIFRRRSVPLEEAAELAQETAEEHRQVLEAVLMLPEKYRQVIYLHYYEGYSAPETAKLLRRNEHTVYTQLARGRELLRRALGGDEDET